LRNRTPAVVVPLFALALGACGGEAPTAARPPAAAVARRVPLAMQGQQLAELRSAVSDAGSRILPALGDAADHAPLREALAAADLALATDDATILAAALHDARAAVAAELATLGPDAAAGPDLDALLLVLDGLDLAVPVAPAIADVP
jgi:hypothetical protein